MLAQQGYVQWVQVCSTTVYDIFKRQAYTQSSYKHLDINVFPDLVLTQVILFTTYRSQVSYSFISVICSPRVVFYILNLHSKIASKTSSIVLSE